jgi:signal transduction histidine kinase
MGLRTKFAAIFLTLLLVPITATAVFEIDRVSALMVENLRDSATLLINQTFEEMRAMPHDGDVVAALQGDSSLRALVTAAQAFGKGVVYLRVAAPNGTVLAGPSAGLYGDPKRVLPFSRLEEIAERGWPPARLRALWEPRVYELSRTVGMNGRPFATIAVGISTSLITPEVHRALDRILLTAAQAIALAFVGALCFGGWVLRRLDAISRGIEQMAIGQRAVTVRISGSDELSLLGDKFNQLSGRINSDQAMWEAEREELLSRFHSIDDAVLLLAGEQVIQFANAEAQGRLGLPAGGLAEGKSLRDLLGEDHPLVRLIQSVHSTQSGVYDVALDSPSDHHQVVSAFPMCESSATPGILVILRDIGPVRELEDAVERSALLMRFSGLVSDVAREIRSPLSNINSQLSLLCEAAEMGQPLEERLEAMRDELERLDKAVEALQPGADAADAA